MQISMHQAEKLKSDGYFSKDILSSYMPMCASASSKASVAPDKNISIPTKSAKSLVVQKKR